MLRKLNNIAGFQNNYDGFTGQLSVPLNQVKGHITDHYNDTDGNFAFLVKHKEKYATPLFSVECLLRRHGMYQHVFVTHTTNEDPTNLAKYLEKTISTHK